MKKRGFYVDKNGTEIEQIYGKLTLRNRYIKWNIARVGIPEDMPDGFWFVTLEWPHPAHRAILPGLLFREA